VRKTLSKLLIDQETCHYLEYFIYFRPLSSHMNIDIDF